MDSFFVDMPYPTVSVPKYQNGAQTLGNLQQISVGGGTTGMRMDSQGFWLGAEKFSDAPFSVSMAGVVHIGGSGTFGALAYKDTVDWSSTDITNKPALGALALKNAVAWATDITGVPSFGSLAYQNLVSLAMLDSTVIVGGYIKTSLIQTSAINVTSFAGAGTLATMSSISYTSGYLTNKPTLGSLASQSAVSLAMLDNTIIVGGYIKTSLLTANNITTGTLTGVSINTTLNSANQIAAHMNVSGSNGLYVDQYGTSMMISVTALDDGTGYRGMIQLYDGGNYGGRIGGMYGFYDAIVGTVNGVYVECDMMFASGYDLSHGSGGGTAAFQGKLRIPVGTNLY